MRPTLHHRMVSLMPLLLSIKGKYSPVLLLEKGINCLTKTGGVGIVENRDKSQMLPLITDQSETTYL